MHEGICYLVGAGPGDPGLLTVRAKELVGQADVILYDYLCSPSILENCKEGAEIFYVGKKAGAHTLPQDEINDLIVQRASAGKSVVRLKGGDPFVFGRGGEEAQALRAAGVQFEIVPGISSAIAGPAYAGIPVTHRDYCSQFMVMTGHENPDKPESKLDYAHIAATPGTKIILMGVEKLEDITGKLLEHGCDPSTPVALVRWATTGSQDTLVSNLKMVAGEANKARFAPPAVMVIGGVVELRDTLNWFENRPLHGSRIIVTRTRKQAGKLSSRLRVLGAEVMELPVIRIEPPADPSLLQQAAKDAHFYDWIVFTSPNGVDAFFSAFYREFDDARCIGGTKIAAIGPGTAKKINEYRLAVDLIPDDYVAEGLLDKLKDESVENLKILLPRAEETREVLADGLSSLGAIVDEVAAYRTVPETNHPQGILKRIQEEGADWITFTSSSTVENFLKLDLVLPENTRAASIGPITSQTLTKHGMEIAVEAESHDIDGLVEALLKTQTKENNKKC